MNGCKIISPVNKKCCFVQLTFYEVVLFFQIQTPSCEENVDKVRLSLLSLMVFDPCGKYHLVEWKIIKIT